MNEEVRKIMTTNPVVASPSQTIEDVSQLMMDSQIQQLPVVTDGKLVGMVTSYDVWKALSGNHNQSSLVESIMTTKIVRIAPKDKVGTAAELFADKRFKTIPVVNLDNTLKGVVTAFDVIRSVFKEEYPQSILYQEEFDK